MMTNQGLFGSTDEHCDTPSLDTPSKYFDQQLLDVDDGSSLFLSFDMEDIRSIDTVSLSRRNSMLSLIDNDSTSTADEILIFVNMLRSKSEAVIFEAASALVHILSINYVDTVIECKAIPVLIRALGTSKQSVRDECIKCLGIIISSSSRHRDIVLDSGGLIALLCCIEKTFSDSSLSALLEVLSAMFAYDQYPSLAFIEPALPKIFDMISLKSTENNVLVECVNILGYLAKCSQDGAQLLRRSSAKECLVQLLNHTDEAVVVSALRASRYLVHPNVDREDSAFLKTPRSDHTQIPSKQVIHFDDAPSPIRSIASMEGKVPLSEYPVLHCRESWYAHSGVTHTRSQQRQREQTRGVLASRASGGTMYASAYDCKPNINNTEETSFLHQQSGRKPQDSETLFHGALPKRKPPKCQYIYPSIPPKYSIDINDTPRVALNNTTIPSSSKPITIKNEILTDKDRHLLSDYICFVLEQLQVCHMDRHEHATYSRYSFPIGFPGLECKHCAGTDHHRRFFWSSVERWKNNYGEFARHLLKCPHCPRPVTDQMNFMKTYHNIQMKSMEKGNMNLVFSRLFSRLHSKIELDSAAKIVPTGSQVDADVTVNENNDGPVHKQRLVSSSPPNSTSPINKSCARADAVVIDRTDTVKSINISASGSKRTLLQSRWY